MGDEKQFIREFIVTYIISELSVYARKYEQDFNVEACGEYLSTIPIDELADILNKIYKGEE